MIKKNILERFNDRGEGNLRGERGKYFEIQKLTKKREIVVFNKIDMASDDEINEKIDAFCKKIKKKI